MNASKPSEHSLRPGESCVEKFSICEHLGGCSILVVFSIFQEKIETHRGNHVTF